MAAPHRLPPSVSSSRRAEPHAFAEAADLAWCYLAPRNGGEEAYAVLAAALRKTGRVGVGRVVLRSREQLVAVVEADQMLRLHTMRFADELVDAGTLDHPPRRRKPDEATPPRNSGWSGRRHGYSGPTNTNPGEA